MNQEQIVDALMYHIGSCDLGNLEDKTICTKVVSHQYWPGSKTTGVDKCTQSLYVKTDRLTIRVFDLDGHAPVDGKVFYHRLVRIENPTTIVKRVFLFKSTTNVHKGVDFTADSHFLSCKLHPTYVYPYTVEGNGKASLFLKGTPSFAISLGKLWEYQLVDWSIVAAMATLVEFSEELKE